MHFHSQELLDYVIIVLERKLLPDGALTQTEKPTFINDYIVLNFKENSINTKLSQVSLCDIDSEIREQIAYELGVKRGRKNVLF